MWSSWVRATGIAAIVGCISASALAAGPGDSVSVVPQGQRLSYDHELVVRSDGQLYLDDELLEDTDLPARIAAVLASDETARVVVAPEAGAPYDRVVAVLDQVRTAAGSRYALEVGDAAPMEDPLFPGAGSVETLDEGLTNSQLNDLAPKRHKFPQNPYGQNDFTAYTLEWGETKIGVAAITHGLAPRVQIGTLPVLDLLGVYNGQAKANFLRAGPFDMAAFGQVYVVPVNDILRRLDVDNDFQLAGEKVNGEDVFTANLTYWAVGGQASLQVVGGWSVHAGVSYARATASGQFDFNNLPVVVFPGAITNDGSVTLVPKISAELVQYRFATDYRFNRRDSIILQLSSALYGRAYGTISGSIADYVEAVEGAPKLPPGIALGLSYGQALAFSDTFRASISYQLSWKAVDLRVGIGTSAIPYTWLLQAFDLSYRFGGHTRRDEGKIKRGYRDNRKDLKQGGDATP